jgi:hypothetical protein
MDSLELSHEACLKISDWVGENIKELTDYGLITTDMPLPFNEIAFKFHEESGKSYEIISKGTQLDNFTVEAYANGGGARFTVQELLFGEKIAGYLKTELLIDGEYVDTTGQEDEATRLATWNSFVSTLYIYVYIMLHEEQVELVNSQFFLFGRLFVRLFSAHLNFPSCFSI